MTEESVEVKNPKVFISYSWTSEKHKKSVVALAERLMSDGVDVSADFYDLKTGHNIHKFMESMVNSSDISKVLIILDEEYKRKSDKGEGGVGTETEIVSSYIYNKASQEKFIPIIWERDNQGNTFVPTFLNSRNYIDLTPENLKDDYPELLRCIFNKPRHIKPKIGKMPLFLEDKKAISKPSFFYTLKKMIESNNLKDNTFPLKNFFKKFSAEIESLIIESNNIAPTDEDIFEKVQSFNSIIQDYDEIIDELVEQNVVFDKYLRFFFESCLLNYTIKGVGSCYTNQLDEVKFVTQELLLHTIAVFLKNEKFLEVNSLISRPILINNRMTNIFEIYDPLSSLDQTRNNRLNINRQSIVADLLKERCIFFPFNFLIQADLILFLRAEFSGNFWSPKTIIYTEGRRSLDLFLRSEESLYFNQFKIALGLNSKEELLEKWKKNNEHLNLFQRGIRYIDLRSLLNIEKLDTI